MNKFEILESLRSLVMDILYPENIDDTWGERVEITTSNIKLLDKEDQEWLDVAWQKWIQDVLMPRLPENMKEIVNNFNNKPKGQEDGQEL